MRIKKRGERRCQKAGSSGQANPLQPLGDSVMGCVNHEFDIDCSDMTKHQARRVSPHVGLKAFGYVAEKQAPFMAVQIKRGAWCYRNFGWRADVTVMTCNMKQLCVARDGDVGTEKIFGFGAMVGDRHMSAGAIGICLGHHDGRMNDL